MQTACRGILSKSQIKWLGIAPPADVPQEVEVRLVIAPSDVKDRRAKIAQLLNEAAKAGGLKSFGDASEWQRDVRNGNCPRASACHPKYFRL